MTGKEYIAEYRDISMRLHDALTDVERGALRDWHGGLIDAIEAARTVLAIVSPALGEMERLLSAEVEYEPMVREYEEVQ